MNDELTLKMTDFSLLSDGDKFFTSRTAAIENGTHFIKIPTTKNVAGIWSNARGPVALTFIKYDSRVWVRK